MSKTPPPKIRYANAAHVQIAALINGLYRFQSMEKAGYKLAALKSQYTVASVQDEEGASPNLRLWIRDFEVSESEEQAGFLGNFALLTCVEEPDGLYSVTARKIETELKFHPLRKRPTARCPNWGHPVLRSIERGKTYPTLEAAQAELQALQVEYCETTIPGHNKLYLMIFSRRESPKKPLERYVLEIENLQGGGFIITCKKNEFKRKPATTPSVSAETADATPAAAQGHFASMVALKRKRKPKA